MSERKVTDVPAGRRSWIKVLLGVVLLGAGLICLFTRSQPLSVGEETGQLLAAGVFVGLGVWFVQSGRPS